jgi:hypothetical protein
MTPQITKVKPVLVPRDQIRMSESALAAAEKQLGRPINPAK